MRVPAAIRTAVVAGLATIAGVGAVVGVGAIAAAQPFPDRIDLPDGFQPEGIAVGQGTRFFAGSLATGALYRGDLRTGEGEVVFPGTGAPSVGLDVDRANRVFVAGGPSGEARVVDGTTGELLRTYRLAEAPTFVNDVIVAGGSAWFTDSMRPVLYRVPLDLGEAETVPLTGDLVYEAGFNVNGIEATSDGSTLVLVQSNTGRLFTADHTGVTTGIDLGGETVPGGDGLLLHGLRLWVVQNTAGLVARIELAPHLRTGTVVARLAPEGVDVPTTAGWFGGQLYLVNARFGTPPAPDTEYWITRTDR